MAEIASKKECIISSFEKMDLEMLELLLDDSNTYQDATKDVFLNKLTESFNEFRESNDTALIAVKGICTSNDCSNIGCAGYSFIGNNSKKHLDLIFNEVENDFTDIYNCSQFERSVFLENVNNQIYFFIKEDEKQNFSPSVEYLVKVQHCEIAYSELVRDEIVYITKEDYFYWLEKYKTIRKTIHFFPSYKNFEKFYWLYERLNELAEFLMIETESKKAINEFEQLNTDCEILLLQWLVKYEEIYSDLILFSYLDYLDDDEIKKGYFRLSGYNNVLIAINDFEAVQNFKTLFNIYYFLP